MESLINPICEFVMEKSEESHPRLSMEILPVINLEHLLSLWNTASSGGGGGGGGVYKHS